MPSFKTILKLIEMKIILLFTIIGQIAGFLIHPTVSKELILLQKCSKYSKSKNIYLSEEIEHLARDLPILTGYNYQNNGNELNNMLLNSNWRIIYSQLTPANLKGYEKYENSNTIITYKNENFEVIAEPGLVRIENTILLIKPKCMHTVNRETNNQPCIMKAVSPNKIRIESYNIIYISDKIKINRSLCQNKYLEILIKI